MFDFPGFLDSDEEHECSTAMAARCSSTLPSVVVPTATHSTLSLEELCRRLHAAASMPDHAKEAIEASLRQVVEAVPRTGPLRDRALCVMARQLVLLLGGIRSRKMMGMTSYMLALRSSIAEVLSGGSDSISVFQPEATFSGRVVFVFGWGGSSIQDMEDCLSSYREMDSGSLLVAFTRSKDLHGLAQVAKAFETAVNTWADAVDHCSPSLLVHLFSNNGFFAWTDMLKLWEEQLVGYDEQRLRGAVPPMATVLRGVILDSAPAEGLPKSCTTLALVQSEAAILAALSWLDAEGKPVDTKEQARNAMQATMEVMDREGPFWQQVEADQERHLACQAKCHEVHSREPLVPLLFVYSTVDRIIPYHCIEQYIADCSARHGHKSRIRIHQLKYTDSAHCMHKMRHAKDYWTAVREFWNDSLSSRNGSSRSCGANACSTANPHHPSSVAVALVHAGGG